MNFTMIKFDGIDLFGNCEFYWEDNTPVIRISNCIELYEKSDEAQQIPANRTVPDQFRHKIDGITDEGTPIQVKDFFFNRGAGFDRESMYVLGCGHVYVGDNTNIDRYGFEISGINDSIYDQNDMQYDGSAVFNFSSIETNDSEYAIVKKNKKSYLISLKSQSETDFDSDIQNVLPLLSFMNGGLVSLIKKIGLDSSGFSIKYCVEMINPESEKSSRFNTVNFFPFPDPKRQCRFSEFTKVMFKKYIEVQKRYDLDRAIYLLLISGNSTIEMRFAQLCIAFEVMSNSYAKYSGVEDEKYFPSEQFRMIEDDIFNIVKAKFETMFTPDITQAMKGKIGALNNKSMNDKVDLLSGSLSIQISKDEMKVLKKRNSSVHWGYINAPWKNKGLNADIQDVIILRNLLVRMIIKAVG